MQGFLTCAGLAEVHVLQLPRTRFTFGSGANMDLTVTMPGLPDYGGSFTWDDARGSWALEISQAARTFLKVNGLPFMQTGTLLEDGTVISLGPLALRFDLMPEVPQLAGTPVRVVPLRGDHLRIGRGNDEGDAAKLVLDQEDGDVSRSHATLEREPDGEWFIKDHSEAGTELNGQAFEREKLVIGDRFRIGHYVFEYTGRSLRRLPSSSAGRLVGRDLSRVVGGGRSILNHVSVDVPPGSFVGLLGGSGQGKSTLMTALCGLNPPTSGEVLVNSIRMDSAGRTSGPPPPRIGFVPQDDIVHMELSVREALTFSARLRLSDAPSDKLIETLVMATAKRLSLEDHLEKKVRQLSGGQRKRVSIATEMLLKPSVLFLDEPSSGLDPATEFYLMSMLRDLAGSDCTVICTTHVLGFSHLFDRVAFVQGGRVVFYGRPADAGKFFQHGEWVDIYLELDRTGKDGARDAAQLQSDYEASSFRPVPEPVIPLVHDQGTAPPAPPPGPWRTLRTLMARQWTILKADKWNLAFLLAQALAIALLIGWVAESAGLRSFLTVVAVLWFGCSNAAQQIVGELAVFRRERVCGLGLNVYLGSKLLFVTFVTALQCLILFVAVTAAANVSHSSEFLHELLLEDERFGGGLDDDALAPEDTPGHGAHVLTGAFGFSEEEADQLVARFPAQPATTADGQPAFDEAAVERAAEVLGERLLAQAIPLRSDEARAMITQQLAPAMAPPRPPKKERPGDLRNWVMLKLVRWFELQDNVLDSKARAIRDTKAEPLRHPVTKKIRYLPAPSLARVVVLPITLRLAAILGAALVGVVLGLAISALVGSPTQAAMVVPLILIPQILFGGYVVTRPQMTPATRMVSQFVPSFAAQRISEVASLYGQSVPFITNSTKIPLFLKGTPETVKWQEDGKEVSEDYERVAAQNTAFQNLVVNPKLLGQRKKEMSGGDDSREKPNVKQRRDVEPYRQGVIFAELGAARQAALILLGWVVVAYLTALGALRKKQPL